MNIFVPPPPDFFHPSFVFESIFLVSWLWRHGARFQEYTSNSSSASFFFSFLSASSSDCCLACSLSSAPPCSMSCLFRGLGSHLSNSTVQSQPSHFEV